MKRLFIILGTLCFLSCSAGGKQDNKFVLWVNSSKGPCVGMAPTLCLEVQKADTMVPLVEILEKKQDLRFRINGAWELRQLNEDVLEAGAEAGPVPRLEIQIGDMRYSGHDGCNRFSGGLIQVDEHTISFGIAAGTRMMCPDMHIPDLFNATLPEVKFWKIQEGNLHLADLSGRVLMQLAPTE